MYVVFSWSTVEGLCGVCMRLGGVGTGIAHAIAAARASDATLTEVRCIGRNLSEEVAREVFDWAKPHDGRLVWANGEVLDRHSDKR